MCVFVCVYVCYVCECGCVSLPCFTFSHKPSILRKTVFYKTVFIFVQGFTPETFHILKKESVKYQHKFSRKVPVEHDKF